MIVLSIADFADVNGNCPATSINLNLKSRREELIAAYPFGLIRSSEQTEKNG
jgi:hypothetical protein